MGCITEIQRVNAYDRFKTGDHHDSTAQGYPLQPNSPLLNQLRELVDQQWQTHGSENAINGLRLTRADKPSGTIRALYQTSFCIVLQGAKESDTPRPRAPANC